MQVTTLSVDAIVEPLIVVRENLDTPEFRELVADIRAHGLEVPIIVRAVDAKFRVVDGYRRWRASREAGLLDVPTEVRDLTDEEEIAVLMRVALHRADFTPLEEGKMFAVMHEGLHRTYEGIAADVGKSVTYVTDRLAVVRGPEDVRQALAAGEINFTVAKELIRVAHDGDRQYCLHWAISQGASVETVRGWVKERLQNRALNPTAAPPATAADNFGEPPVAMGSCEWHHGPAPLNAIVSYRVCSACYDQLQVINARLEARRRAEEEATGVTSGS